MRDGDRQRDHRQQNQGERQTQPRQPGPCNADPLTSVLERAFQTMCVAVAAPFLPGQPSLADNCEKHNRGQHEQQLRPSAGIRPFSIDQHVHAQRPRGERQHESDGRDAVEVQGGAGGQPGVRFVNLPVHLIEHGAGVEMAAPEIVHLLRLKLVADVGEPEPVRELHGAALDALHLRPQPPTRHRIRHRVGQGEQGGLLVVVQKPELEVMTAKMGLDNALKKAPSTRRMRSSDHDKVVAAAQEP